MTDPVLRISRSQFQANIAAVSRRIAPSVLMLVMKDDAYGHGCDWAVGSAASSGVQWFGSYDVPTALRMRGGLHDGQRIFAWVTSTAAEIDEALRQDIDLGVGTIEYLQTIIARASILGRRARVHLKIDTGLHRNGILADDWDAAVAAARAAETAGAVELVGVWSHLAEASDEEDNDAQAVFLTAVDAATGPGGVPLDAVHLTASAASWWRPELRGSLSRVGAFCFGIRSADGPDLDGIRPIATLVAPVMAVVDGRAIIGLGSFDGLASTLTGVTVGTPAGARALHRINHTTAVVDGWPGMAVGDEVFVFGVGDHGEHSATTLAEHIGTVGEEILTRLSPRVRRVVND